MQRSINSVLITGSSRGLGRSLAEIYLSMGVMVFGCSRSPSAIDHRNYRHFRYDISDEASVVSMFKEINSFKIKLDMLINNASLTQSSIGILTSSKIAQEIINTNFLGSFLVTREALKLMERNRFGRIINFSSINVLQGSVGSSLYNASKSAVEALSQSLSREHSRADITINNIGLSLVNDTGMLASLSLKAVEEKQKHLIKSAPLNVEEIIHAINFFASPLSKNICAQTIYFG